MSKKGYIEHYATVEEVLPNHIKVLIVSESACAGCHAKGACTASDLQDKIIDIYQPEGTFKVGQKVMLMGENSLAPKAVLLAYIFPIILLLATLMIVFHTTHKEALAGLLSLGILLPYYGIIYLYKDKLQRTFSFTIKQ